MASAIEELDFKLYLFLINSDLSDHKWLVSTVQYSRFTGLSWAFWSVEWVGAQRPLAVVSLPLKECPQAGLPCRDSAPRVTAKECTWCRTLKYLLPVLHRAGEEEHKKVK